MALESLFSLSYPFFDPQPENALKRKEKSLWRKVSFFGNEPAEQGVGAWRKVIWRVI
jgi:hypothetical protein